MANEIRARFNLVSGTLSSSLTNVATSMSSAGLANLGVIDATNYAAVTIENEIVWVTAHTAGATTATILRAQEGTAAAAHSSSVAWQHGPTAFDLGTDWTSWTPTWTNLTVGNGTVLAKYTKISRTVHFRIKFTLGSSSSVGTGPVFTLPVTAASDYIIEWPIGPAVCLDSGVKAWSAYCQLNSTTQGLIRSDDGAGGFGNVAATSPFTWGTADYFMITGTYEAAA